MPRLLICVAIMPLFVGCAVGSAGDSVDPSPAAPAPAPSSSAARNPGQTAPTSNGDSGGSGGSADGGADSGASNDAGSSGGSACTGYAAPTTKGTCHSCGTKPCQANGCYGGYYCELAQNKCVAKPSGC